MADKVEGLKMGIEMLDNTLTAFEQIITASNLFSPYLYARGLHPSAPERLTEEEMRELLSILGRLAHMEARLSWAISRLS